MKRFDRIKLDFTRNWRLPGRERMSNLLKPSAEFKKGIKNGITWFADEDIAIYTSGDSYIEWSILSTGTYEDEINKVVRISLKIGDNALDIGGNIGLQSLRMSQCVGQTGQVLAFEPLQYLQEKFRRNLALNKAANVSLFPCALSDSEGNALFSVDSGAWNQGTFSLMNNATGTEKQEVMIKVGDSVPEIAALRSLSLIKIDVEGFEYHVLRGLRQTLEKHKPRLIFEYDENYWQRNNESIAHCYAFLSSLGYTIYQVTSAGCELLSSPTQIVGGNLFCVPDKP